jgi:hypothetical protein
MSYLKREDAEKYLNKYYKGKRWGGNNDSYTVYFATYKVDEHSLYSIYSTIKEYDLCAVYFNDRPAIYLDLPVTVIENEDSKQSADVEISDAEFYAAYLKFKIDYDKRLNEAIFKVMEGSFKND